MAERLFARHWNGWQVFKRAAPDNRRGRRSGPARGQYISLSFELMNALATSGSAREVRDPCTRAWRKYVEDRAGRLVVAPDKPSSLNTVWHSAFFNPAIGVSRYVSELTLCETSQRVHRFCVERDLRVALLADFVHSARSLFFRNVQHGHSRDQLGLVGSRQLCIPRFTRPASAFQQIPLLFLGYQI